MDKPLVSICCITYNHAAYIRQCLNGFMMQRTDFSFEIIVHDDASTDNTVEVIEEYVTKHPDIFVPIYQSENQYSKKVKPLLKYVFPKAKGKYIAICEGDDYWTDPLKLQKQVDFLEAHPEFSLACGGYIKKHLDSEEEVIINDPKAFPNTNDVGFEFGIGDLHKKWLTKTLTTIFRRDACQVEELNKYRYVRDVHLFYHIIKNGKGVYFQEIFGVYNIHEGGVHSMVMEKGKVRLSYYIYKELYKYNKDVYTRKKAFKSSVKHLELYSYDRSSDDNFMNKVQLFYEVFSLVRSIDDIKRLLKVFVYSFKRVNK